MNPHILMVDDELNVLEAFERNLRKSYAIDVALGGEQGLAFIEKSKGKPYFVIIADMQMPGMNGIEFLSKAEVKTPDTTRIMLTGNADQKTAVDAVNQGHVFRFLNKPCSIDILSLTIEAGIKQFRLVTAERELLEKTLNGSIKALTDILSVVEPQSFTRSQVLVEYTRKFIASHPVYNKWELEIAAMVSQIGGITIPSNISAKARAGTTLSTQELELWNRIPLIGCKLLAHIPRLEMVAQIVLYQGKNFDGSGFPSDVCSGEKIPISSRILKVLSDLILLESKGASKMVAFENMRKRQGWYDPKILDATYNCFTAEGVETSESKGTSIPVSVKDLHLGHILAANLETVDDVLIVPKGVQISQALLEKIKNFAEMNQIKEPVYISG